MKFSEIIKKINSDKRLVPDLLKAPKGNNFRAVSESAILDVINPIFNEYGIFYKVEVEENHLDIKEAWGSKGRKLQFIATLRVRLCFYRSEENGDEDPIFETEAVGMGIDDNDKAMGKAYTYAVKYALLKLFRLQFGDDADAEASEPLYLEKPKESNTNDKEEEKKPAPKKKKEQLMSPKQKDYILGLMKQKKIPMTAVLGHFHGMDPERDEIPMAVARSMIDWLEQQEDDSDLPF